MKLWERHCIWETIKTLLLVLSSFYLVYILIDYALHTKAFGGGEIPFGQICLYYLSQFSKQLQLLLPFALLLSGIKVLTTLNLHNELVALLAAGVKAKQLLRPLLLVAIACAGLLWANSQWLLPHAAQQAAGFETLNFQSSSGDRQHLHTIRLQDGSTLLYHGWDAAKEAFQDAVWLRKPGELFRIKRLYPTQEPTAEYVDQLHKGKGGAYVRQESWVKRAFPEMEFDENELFTALRPPQQMPISLLWNHRPTGKQWTDRDARLVTQLNLKLALPFICLIVILLPAPWCLQFSRRPSIFLLYAISIGGYLVFLTGMDAVAILGENQVFSPTWVVWAPIFALAGLSTFRFARI